MHVVTNFCGSRQFFVEGNFYTLPETEVRIKYHGWKFIWKFSNAFIYSYLCEYGRFITGMRLPAVFLRSGMGVIRPGLLKPSNYFVLLKKTEL